MSSRLLDIYGALQAYEVVVDNVAVPNRGLEFNGTVNALPHRILSPLHERADGRGIIPLTFGGASSLQWVITDLCLVGNVTAGSGLEYFMSKMVKYQAAYVSNIFADKHLGIGSLGDFPVTVNTCDIEIGVYEYPLGSEKWYYGVKATWTIRENLG